MVGGSLRASSTTITGRHDIAEILLKVALKHQKSKSQSNLLAIRFQKRVVYTTFNIDKKYNYQS
jgi:hypothetical protein